MTVEQKAKAYDEALEVMRQWVAPCHTKEQLDTMKKSVFPELNESEDERIRKWLHDYISNCPNNNFTFYGGVGKDAVLNYLEKQKEIHKSSDSIPSDCTADAKYEDRWHKVIDFLPNSAKEVLCKDAIGNFFIGRYYKSTQSWEVVMYDDCDKDNEDNPPVVKWCEIPSEKQKEQKPAEDKYQQELEATDRWQEGYEAGYNAASKPAEWSEEDERMRNQLIYDIEYHKKEGLVSAKQNKATKSFCNRLEECYDEKIDWLKSLRPSWKPSLEQLSMLLAVINDPNNAGSESCQIALRGIYEQLKKLM